MADTFMQYEDEDTGIVARWHGGEYIDLGWIDPRDGEFHAGDVINVWDHAKGEARISFTLDALRETVESHINDEDEDEEDEE